jgi:hypothetical protein
LSGVIAQEAIALSPAEALFLLKPNMPNGFGQLRVTLLWLLAKRILTIENVPTKGFFGSKNVPHIRVTGRSAGAPPHVAVVEELARTAQAADLSVRDMIKAAEKRFSTGCLMYTAGFIAPAVIERGLVERRKVLLSFVYHRTSAGEEQSAWIHAGIERARELPALLRSNREQAVALALTLGDTILLSDSLKKHLKELSSAMGGSDGSGGSSFDASSTSTDHIDLSCFDADAFSSLDGCMDAFDTGFSDGGGGGSDGGQ